jgi:cholesterol transport system auxiliary component
MRARLRIQTLLTICALAVAHGGCALTSKADAVSPRFFSPEPETRAKALPEPEGAGLELRLGDVDAASHLEERISYRLHASELAYYEDRLWTEPPEQYLRRALERELFERRHIRRVVSGAGATLEVELTAFEEFRGPPARVRLALSYTLYDGGQSSLERSLVVERPLATDARTDRAQQVAAALALCLTAAVSELSNEVARNLRAPVRDQAPFTEPSAPAKETSERARPRPSGNGRRRDHRPRARGQDGRGSIRRRSAFRAPPDDR